MKFWPQRVAVCGLFRFMAYFAELALCTRGVLGLAGFPGRIAGVMQSMSVWS